MEHYRPLFTVSLEHQFFADRECRDISFQPTAETLALLGKAPLLMKMTRNGFTVIATCDGEALNAQYGHDSDKPLSLVFKAFMGDFQFGNYTDLAGQADNTILSFDNANSHVDRHDKLRLHSGEYVSATDLIDVESPALDRILDAKDKLIKPIFVVRIDLAKTAKPNADKGGSTHKYYCIRFNTRKTIWKYHLLGKIWNETSYIADLNNEAQFEFVGESVFSESRTAFTFMSKKTIPLMERSSYRFQLRDKVTNGGKVLIKRLPVASTNQIFKEKINGKETVVSEIFINY